jgi:DNA polymerase
MDSRLKIATLYGDLETYSEVPIKHGTYKYAENCEVMLFSYAIDDGPVKVWDVIDELVPSDLSVPLFDDSVELVFQNSMFDRTVMRLEMECDLPITRFRDTMVQALAHSLPGALGKLCAILNIPHDQRKMDTGRQLIHLFCKPRPKNSALRRATRDTHPQEWAQFVEYAAHDVEAMRAIYKKLPTWNYSGDELALWHLDQRINDRGMCVDTDLATAAVRTVKREKDRLARRTGAITNGAVGATTQRDVLLAYLLAEHGAELPDLQAATLERRLTDTDLPAEVRELIAIRQQASSTSPTKYTSLLNAVSADGRLRGTKQFDGAARTGRWAGRVFQPDNLMRIPKHVKPQYDELIGYIKADSVDLLVDDPIEICASVVRGSIIPGPGKKFAISDLSNIEGRVLAWLAGEEWKLQAFRDYDAGTGHDIYAIGYARSFGGTPEEVMADDKAGGIKRQVGKVQELASGYQGAVGALVTMAQTYKLDLEQLVAEGAALIDETTLAKAREAYAGVLAEMAAAEAKSRPPRMTDFGLSERAYTVLWSLVFKWREANSKIRAFWYDLEAAVRASIVHPERTTTVGSLCVDRRGNWLRIRLPSGRFLCYPAPKVNIETGKISYMGMNQYTKQWSRIGTYGGKLAENVTQAVARDILAVAMPVAEAAGFEIVLHVHDELVTEIPLGGNSAGLGEIMRTAPAWADGLPLAASAYETNRYRKE